MPLALTCGLTTMSALRPSSLVSLVLGILLLDEKDGIQRVIKLEQIQENYSYWLKQECAKSESRQFRMMMMMMMISINPI
jgi:hypothetical protein